MTKKNFTGGYDAGSVRRRLLWTWLQTLLGIAVMAGLTVSAFLLLGFKWSFGVIFLLLWVAMPIFGWYMSGPLVRRLMRCQEPNPDNPRHMRLVRIVDNLFLKTGLKHKPPVYVSPIPLPNAFATGRSPSQAFIACTEGLFRVGLTDDELEAVIAHELAHVKTYDVAIGSLMAVMGSFFSLLLAGGLPRMFNSAFISSDSPLLDELSFKVQRDKKRFFLPEGGVLGFIVMLVIFYIVSIFTKVVAMFVGRTRESAADVLAAHWTNKPCALSTSLQKINRFMERIPVGIKLRIITRGLTPILMVSDFEGRHDEHGAPASNGVLVRLRRWWRHLGENHPPIPKRLAALDRMSGGSCPRL